MLATIRDPNGLSSVRQLLSAHKYWRMKGVRCDLVILNAKAPSYIQDLHDTITTMVVSSSEGGTLETPGGVFIHRMLRQNLEVLGPDPIMFAVDDPYNSTIGQQGAQP